MARPDSKETDETELDDQLNVPVRSEDKTELRIEAAKKGMSMSKLARQRLFGEDEKITV